MKNYKNSILFFIAIIFISSCGSKSEFDLDLLPFKEKNNGRWGYVDSKGNIKIETGFIEKPSLFREGFAIIKTRDGYFDYINNKGEEMDLKFVHAALFNENLAGVVEKDQYPVFIDKNMEVIFTLDSIEEVGTFSEGLAKFKNAGEKWGFIDKKGKIIIKPEYDKAKSFSEKLALVTRFVYEETDSLDKTGNKKSLDKKIDKIQHGFIDHNGNEVIALTDKFNKLRSFKEGLAAYSDGIGYGWGFINKKGQKVIRANKHWDNVIDFVNGYASFLEDGGWGLIDENGEIVLKPNYRYPLTFHQGLSLIKEDDKFGFINIKGEKKILPDFDDVALDFHGKYAIVKNGNYYIFIGKDGDQINKNEFRIVDFSAYTHLDEIVKNDFFDVIPVIDSLIKTVSLNEINGLNLNTSVQDVLDEFYLTNDNLPKSKYKKYIEIKKKKINKDVSFHITIHFDKNVSLPIKKRSYQGSGWYRYYTTKIVGYKPNTKAKLKKINYAINLKNKAYGKGDNLAKAIKKNLEATGFKFIDIKSSENEYIFGTESNVEIVHVLFKDNKVEFSYTLNEDASVQVIADK